MHGLCADLGRQLLLELLEGSAEDVGWMKHVEGDTCYFNDRPRRDPSIFACCCACSTQLTRIPNIGQIRTLKTLKASVSRLKV